jgi:hypothetical protein
MGAFGCHQRQTSSRARTQLLPIFAARLKTAPAMNDQCDNGYTNPLGDRMQRWTVPIKLFAYLIVLLMLAAMGYAAFTAVKYWPAISV